MVKSLVNSPNSGLEAGESSNINEHIASPPIPITGNNNHSKYDQIYIGDSGLDPLDYAPPIVHNQLYIHQYNKQQQQLQQQQRLLIIQQRQLQQLQQLQQEQNHANLQQYQKDHTTNTGYNTIYSNLQGVASADNIKNNVQQSTHHQSIFNFDDISSLGLIDSQYSKPQSADFTYNKFDFELANPSLESIPDSISNPFDYAGSQNCLVPTPNAHAGISHSPYNATINDTFTSSFSDTSSFTPNSATEEYFRPMMGSSLKHLTSLSAFPPAIKSGNSNSKINKKSLNELNTSLDSKKSLMMPTNFATSTTSSSPSVESPSWAGASPIYNRYKGADFSGNTNLRVDPQTPNPKIVHHNSESFPSSSNSQRLEEGRRKTYPLFNEFLVSTLERLTPSKSSHSLLSTQTGLDKPKKYTRRRLLPRSKNGCWICRIKHLKCDETRPFCTSCAKLGIECDYSSERPDYITDKNLKKEKLASISVIRKLKQANNKYKI
ncbi:Fungal Zn(2)-Cys(6) binuclear cluster domain-containing protein [Debaryomyces fabryi]|uniref:Fungal Zn(2)-Cys(6) binuclear cluster domain-containing protein n=1 Tax=Debaryomyces fabryi TaxID=58627 RepID=A0A0V1PT61_9ASCO|nr:Fungal Zn(2)-Cys(6) binuclear cluster domain-containing protein [Debaryomyces fabryi]KRZ99440.1 Fungal Zn(2)-Cys(6) binuclear cluster domain-containing protein [Debaryomyces fabryi]CUM46607.1 unnamed protein product [Debaryomyces fabryi]